MNGRLFKVLHWHIVTWIHFIVSDNPFERSPRITFIQHQVRRLLRRLRGMSLARSFGWRGRISLDRQNGLVGHHVNHWVVQIYHRRSKFWNLGKRILARLLLLRTLTTWKVTKVHWAENSLPLPCLDSRLLDDWGSGVVLDLDVLISTGNSLLLVFVQSSYFYGKENKFKLKKKKRKEEGEKKWTTLTSSSSFFMSKILCSRYRAKSPSG